MSTSGTWCDNIIIQAVSNAFNCIIHITESDINKPDGTVITPVLCQEQPKTIFIGYINELHYVSSVPEKTGKNKSKLTYLKRKLLETDDQKETRLAKRRNAYETDDQKETRLAKRRKAYEKMKSLATDEERQKRLAKQKDNINQKRAQENAHGTMGTAGITNQELKTKSEETQNVTKQNLTESGKKSQESLESIIGYCVNKQSDSLIPIPEHKHMFNNIDCFHNSNEYKIKQCIVCLEAWPIKSSSRSQKDSEYQCIRCNRDKKHPTKI